MPDPHEGAPPATVPLPDGVTAEMIARGEELFHGNAVCHSCHGSDGSGSRLAPNLGDADWIHIDGSLSSIVELIIAGVEAPIEYPGFMLARAGMDLSDAQVRDVAAFVWSLGRR